MTRKPIKTWVISDTHSTHRRLRIPDGVDMVIHSGDSTNYYNYTDNLLEFHDFKDWFLELPIKYKVIIAGNHDAWAMKRYNIEDLKDNGIIYLEHEYTSIEDRVIFGSPYTPTFGNWYFMKDRGTISRSWEALGTNIDVLITHGPPKGVLDLTENRDYTFEQCGDSALLKKVITIKPKFHVFGHIHDFKSCRNNGILVQDDITFINASAVEDGKFEFGPKHNGHIIEV